MTRPPIILTIRSGAFVGVENLPPETCLEVRDLDADNYDASDLTTLPDGTEAFVTRWNEFGQIRARKS